MAFPHEHLEQLKDALLNAFTEAELKQLLQYDLQRDLDTIVAPDNLSTRIFELLRWAESEGCVEKLFDAALARKSGNPKLRVLAGLLAAPPVTSARRRHRMNIVPSIWDATWTCNDATPIEDLMKIESWTDDNRFSGHGMAKHLSRPEPGAPEIRRYNYSFTGHVEPVGVIVMQYRAENYPREGAKNVGVAILDIRTSKLLVGYWCGYSDKREPSQRERDRLTYPEGTPEPDRFYIPLGSMSYYGGDVEMRFVGQGE